MIETHPDDTSRFSIYLLLPLIILAEGFVSISVEILTIRQLLPVAGGSVVVTSLIIGIFLLFLALGYHQGGKSSQHPQKKLCLNFFMAAIWLGTCLSYIFISSFFHLFENLSGSHIIYPLIAYLLLIIAPLIFILGQTIPITLELTKTNWSQKHNEISFGKIGGNTLGLSTLGSFLGATITTLVLMYFFGVAWTIVINFSILLILAILLLENHTNWFFYLAMLLAILITYYLNIKIEKQFFVLTDTYANYQILDNKNSNLTSTEKILMINDAPSSYINQDHMGFHYIEVIKKLIFDDLRLRHAEILVLGAGGFTLTAENIYDNHFTYIDIDPQLKKVVIPNFVNQLNSTLINDDARHYLNSTKNVYDAIVIDTYSDPKVIPAHLLTHEYMKSIKNRLKPDGVAIFNIIANPFLSDLYSKRVDNTIRFVFENCVSIPWIYADRPTNIIYACRNNKNQNDNKLYSDNLNNSTTDSFAW